MKTVDLRMLRWAAAVLPLLFLASLDVARHVFFPGVLHSVPGFLGTYAVIAIGVAAFSVAIFGFIGRLQRRIVDQNSQLSAQNRELGALLEIGRATTAVDDLDRLLSHALDTLIRFVPADAAEVWLTGPDDSLAMRCHRGASAAAFLERTHLDAGEGIPGLVARTGAPTITHDLPADARFVRRQVTLAGFKTSGAVPLRYRNASVGVLAVAAHSAVAFGTEAEARLLEAVAEQLALAIVNARLQRKVQDSAVLQEREWIAREMHDGVGQLLGYINLQSMAVKTLLARDEVEAARTELTKMQEIARDLFADVREGILGLRAAGPRPGGVIAAVGNYVASYRDLSGIDTRVDTHGGAESSRLAPPVEIQLMRIVQEALTNVRKHAGAKTATVRFDRGGARLRVTIADDGSGFDAAGLRSRGRPRFGLQTMRERAEAVGGTLEIESSAGRGTTVRVSVPVEG